MFEPRPKAQKPESRGDFVQVRVSPTEKAYLDTMRVWYGLDSRSDVFRKGLQTLADQFEREKRGKAGMHDARGPAKNGPTTFQKKADGA